MSLISNLRLRGFKDILNFRKWKIFVRFFLLKAWKKEYAELSIPEYLEQIAYRMTRPGCRPCLSKGQCIHCGCKSPELFFDKDNYCSGNNWYEMQPPELWKEYKEMNNIVIDPFYIEQIRKKGIITEWQN